MGNFYDYAEKEMQIAGMFDTTMDLRLAQDALSIIKLIDDRDDFGHSGSSMAYMMHIITSVMNYTPLSPLRGGEDEWMDVGDGMRQNVRCARIFMYGDVPKDCDYYTYEDKDGHRWHTSKSAKIIEFPYVPGPPVVLPYEEHHPEEAE